MYLDSTVQVNLVGEMLWTMSCPAPTGWTTKQAMIRLIGTGRPPSCSAPGYGQDVVGTG